MGKITIELAFCVLTTDPAFHTMEVVPREFEATVQLSDFGRGKWIPLRQVETVKSGNAKKGKCDFSDTGKERRRTSSGTTPGDATHGTK